MLIAFKIKLALACAAGLVGPLAFVPMPNGGATRGAGAIAVVKPALVDVASGTVSYREGGDFTRAGKPAEAPLLRRSFSKPLSIICIRSHPPTIRPASRTLPARRSNATS